MRDVSGEKTSEGEQLLTDILSCHPFATGAFRKEGRLVSENNKFHTALHRFAGLGDLLKKEIRSFCAGHEEAIEIRIPLQNHSFCVGISRFANDADIILVSLANLAQTNTADSLQKATTTSTAGQTEVPTLHTNRRFTIDWCNEAFENLSGFGLRWLKGKDPFETMAGADMNTALLKRIRHRMAAGESFSEEIRFHRKSGQAFWCRMYITAKQETEGFSISFIDISREKETRIKLENQLQQKEAILKAIPDMIYRVRKDGVYLECLAYNKTDLLLPAKEIKGINFFDMPESMELKNLVWGKIQQAFKTGRLQVVEYKRKNSKGIIQDYEARISLSGPDEVIYFVRNITQKKRAISNIAYNEKKWRSIVENGFDGIGLADADGIVRYISPNISRIIGYHPKDLVGKTSLVDFTSTEFELREVLEQITSTKTFRARTEQEIVTATGEKKLLEFSITSLLQDPAVAAIVVNFRDISDRRRFETSLIQSNANLHSVLNNTNDLIWLVDKNEHILISNKPFEQAFLHERKNAMARVSDVLPDYAKTWQPLYQKVWKTGKRVNSTTEFPGGNVHEVSLYPVKDKNGRINAISGFSKDITFKRLYEERIRESEKTISTILQTTSAGIVILDGVQVRYVNQQCAKMLGYTVKKLMNSDLSGLLSSNKKTQATSSSENNQHKKHWEINVPGKSGTPRWFDVRTDQIEYYGKTLTIATLTDITGQKNYEAKLIEAKEIAEEVTQMKSGFLANMSHEIRTPLNGVLGLAEIIGMSDNLEEIQEMVKLQKISGERLLNTLTSILELSKLEAENKNVSLSKVEINNLASEITKSWQAQAKAKNLELSFKAHKTNLFCLANETMLYQIINNLVNNALKFTETGGIYISCSVAKNHRGEKCVVIKVKDTGIGVSKEFIPQIFEKFSQESHNTGRKYGGSGLGLAIAKKYMNLLNGSITLSSKKGKGSIFSVILPLRN